MQLSSKVQPLYEILGLIPGLIKKIVSNLGEWGSGSLMKHIPCKCYAPTLIPGTSWSLRTTGCHLGSILPTGLCAKYHKNWPLSTSGWASPKQRDC